MKISLQDSVILVACIAIPAWCLWMLHWLDSPYFISLRNNSDGLVWFVLIGGELLYLISRFIRRR